MAATSRSNLIPWAVLAAAAVVYCGWALAPSSGLYTEVLTPPRAIRTRPGDKPILD